MFKIIIEPKLIVQLNSFNELIFKNNITFVVLLICRILGQLHCFGVLNGVILITRTKYVL